MTQGKGRVVCYQRCMNPKCAKCFEKLGPVRYPAIDTTRVARLTTKQRRLARELLA
jgi:hypothetical protein